ncbi:diacylglycerol kinase family protein [Lentzea sp. NPDC051838]|uniref:diacylglycerol/lipid kinase family protein n=1 Tax=Lentzea sp. NPDC051838 TaxID=3154849 RepID=UPI00342ADD33
MADTRRRWLARFALLAAGAAVVLVLAVAGLRAGVGLVAIGVAGTALTLAGVWWFLTRRGVLQWLAGFVVVFAPVAVAVVYAQAGLVWLVGVCAVLWMIALACGRRALGVPGDPDEEEVAPPRHPYLIMNPRSGGGKVGKFGLAERAWLLGARVYLLDGEQDVAEIARQAVRDGADLLGVAGGDGTQALVAEVAAAHGVPFLVIPAGTRNHFALDLGLDRDDPVGCLDALSDGVELRVDLGVIGDRTFVNNASFGAYADLVRSPAYRDDKMGTMLDLLPELLAQEEPERRLHVQAGEVEVDGPQAVLVSNNPYGTGDLAGWGRRPCLDGGQLGVLAVTVHNAAEAVGLMRGRRGSAALLERTAPEVVITADTPLLAVGIDGEAVTMPTPVRCSTRPGALRVRVPRHRDPIAAPRPAVDWARLHRLAFTADLT